MKQKTRRSACPVACTLDILGDRWSMVVIRDLFLGVSRFNDFLKSPEHITTSILTVRLQQLEEEGIVTKSPYQDRPVRYAYALTEKGRQLGPVMKAMVDWARNWQEEVIRAPLSEEMLGVLKTKL